MKKNLTLKLSVIALSALTVTNAFAFPAGVTGRSNVPVVAEDGTTSSKNCFGCHAKNDYPYFTAETAITAAQSAIRPNGLVDLTLTQTATAIAEKGSVLGGFGFNMSKTAGQWVPYDDAALMDDSYQIKDILDEDGVTVLDQELTHTDTREATAKGAGDGSVEWKMQWQAPAEVGEATFYACVNPIDNLVEAESGKRHYGDGAAVEEACVSLTVNITNNVAPVAVADSATTNEESAVSINLVGNDTDDVAIAADTVTIVTDPAYGTVTVDASGTATYTPNDDYFGNDEFAYTVEDAEGAVSESAVVSVTVNEVEDKDDSDGGSTGGVMLAFAALAGLFRRTLKK